MRIMRFNRVTESTNRARLGVLLDGDLVGDLRAGYARYLIEEQGDAQGPEIAGLRVPPHLGQLLQIGSAAREAVLATADWLRQLARHDATTRDSDGGPLFTPLAECWIHAPVRPGKLVVVGQNYRNGLSESATATPNRVPSASIKATSAIIGPMRDIVKPAATRELDYGTQVAVVIGQRCKNVPESKAYDVVAGYIVVNDISARDILRVERREEAQFLATMFDTFAPMGPWLVTKDEVADPMHLAIRTRVNGEVRQNGTTADMIQAIPELLAYVSQMTLEPGDVITTGTPGRAGIERTADPPSWFLKGGDMLESEVESIGMLRNKIVDEQPKDSPWRW